MQKLKSGEIAPKSGTYKVVDQKGNVAYTVNMEKGETMPPTQGKQLHFEVE